MNRIILMLMGVLLGNIIYAQPLIETTSYPITFIKTDPKLFLSKTSSDVTLGNPFATDRSSKRLNMVHRLSGKLLLPISVTNSSGDRGMSFIIEDINNNPSKYKYSVINESNGKQEHTDQIYWGIQVNMEDDQGLERNICFWFANIGTTYLRNGGYSCNISGNTPQRGEFDDGWQEYYSNIIPQTVNIFIKKVDQNHFRADIEFDNWELKGCSIDNITRITDVEFIMGSGSKIRISNLQYHNETEYAKYADIITKANRLMDDKNYLQAAVEYSKVIEQGYKNYDIYIKRANAYFAHDFLVNAIEDYTTAISYEPKQEAFLLRGKAKLLHSDASGLEDLKKGGVEGEAILKEIENNGNTITNNDAKQYQSSGSGFILTSNGVIVTNYHVIEKANGIDILISQNGNVKTYKAKVLISDKTNDISLLKIEDNSFTKFATIPYAINTQILDVGTKVFALGYPMSNILGEEIKLTDGLISSKTGYQGDIVTYQISAPIQPGNSGGPLFDQNGNIVGITNAGVPDAQNVGYAIKTSYLRNLVDVAPETITLPTQNSISGLSFTEKIKKLTPYVVLIKVY